MTQTTKTAAKRKPAAPKKEFHLRDGFIKIADSKPGVESHSMVQSSSKPLLLQLESGDLTHGKMYRWDRDMNAPHIQAKDGDIFFADENGTAINNVVAYQEYN